MAITALEKNNKKASLPAPVNKKTFQSLQTEELTVMREQKKDASLFSSIPVDKKNKIASFEMIGWTDPNAASSNKAMKWLKSL